ncbi:hypothetical protein [uncultured Alcanivorax sp.]|uniref:hypothetical protein n=1 Tax=uncultured Alcanivorax sp. TaxID=191215 RepID=UPI002628CFC1|nr:hypothetical protein [uncultured Alcanivorax sp.]
MSAQHLQSLDLFQGNYQDPAVPKWRADLQEMLGDAFHMRHYPDLFPHDYAADMCASLAKRLWEANAMSYQDYARYCRFASKMLGTDLRQRHIRIAYKLALDVGPTLPEGHNSPQESAAKNPNVSRAEPRPRRPVAPATPKPTASQRFLHRFGAGDTLRATTPQPRAMNNPHPQARQHLLLELQGDLLADSATNTTTTGNAHGTRENQPAAHAATGPACHPAAPQTATQHTGGGQQ